ncbi:MAG: molybdopterin-guanine dinucleotide biosynthesis protein B [Candidatus Methanoperedens sp.]|nr:molybdopterin-guanine dinucleotide biosynthesis protein B [Candidatus Methanoperedens sp.]
MKPPVICIVGKSKSMKSMIMQELISKLKACGLKVGALKYHKHGDFDIDIKGKDTWKYANAGADTVAISSSMKFALIKKASCEPDIDDIIEHDFADCDIVLADGFTLSDKPRIIVIESEEDIDVFKRGCEVLAVIYQNAGNKDIPGLASTVSRFCDFKKGKN